MPRQKASAGQNSSIRSASILEHRIILNKTHTQYAVIGRCAKRLGWNTFSEHATEHTAAGSAQSGSPRGTSSYVGVSNLTEEEPDAVKKHVDWNVFWTDSGLNIDRVIRTTKIYQKVNHFPGMVNIYRKSNLARSMSKMVKINSKEYDFFPKTWILPAESADVIKYLNYNITSATERSTRCVIVKPSGGAQGKGIYLCMHPQLLQSSEDAVAQVYIHRPLLINSFKFDLRIYALVTCVDPLRVLLYKDGLVRLCTAPYKTPNVSNVGISYMHLTNYSVNKHNESFVENNLDEEGDASKRSLSWLWQWMRSQGHSAERVRQVWRDIGDVIVKTLISIQSTLAVNYSASKIGSANSTPFTCFEVLGFDILLTEALSPVLIEVNHTPSFRTDSALDAQVKEGLITDTLQLLNVGSDDRHKHLLRSAALSQMRLYGNLFDESPRSRQRASLAQGESIERQWDNYLRNEKRFKGGFDVIYPATESDDTELRTRQPVYEGLLRSASETYWNSDLGKLVAVPPPPPPLQRAASPVVKSPHSDSLGQSSASGKEKGEREKKQLSAATRQKMIRDKERERLREKERADRKRRSLAKKQKGALRRSKDSTTESSDSAIELPISDCGEGQNSEGGPGEKLDVNAVKEDLPVPELYVEQDSARCKEGELKDEAAPKHEEEREEWVMKRVTALCQPSAASRLRGRKEMKCQEDTNSPPECTLDANNEEKSQASSVNSVGLEVVVAHVDNVSKEVTIEVENEAREANGEKDVTKEPLELDLGSHLPPAPPLQHASTEPIRSVPGLRTSTEHKIEDNHSPPSTKLPVPTNGCKPVVVRAMGGLNEIEVLRARYSEYRNRWLQEYREAAALRPLKST